MRSLSNWILCRSLNLAIYPNFKCVRSAVAEDRGTKDVFHLARLMFYSVMRTLLSTENILRFANFLVVFGIPRMLYMEVTSFTNYDPASCFHQFPFGKFEKATRAVSKTTGSANHGYVEHVSAFLAPVVKTGDREWSYELCVRYCQFFQFRTNLNHRIHTLSKCVLFQDLDWLEWV